MKTNIIHLKPDRLNFPLETCAVGKLSSAVFTICGDIPDDIDALAVEIERTPDQQTHNPRPNFTAAATRKPDGTFSCYLSPFNFPEIASGLHYHVMGTDTAAPTANPRWLGTGDLRILENPANGSSVTPEIIPADTYVRNPVAGLYHKLVAEVNEDGELSVAIDKEGISK